MQKHLILNTMFMILCLSILIYCTIDALKMYHTPSKDKEDFNEIKQYYSSDDYFAEPIVKSNHQSSSISEETPLFQISDHHENRIEDWNK